MPLVQVVISVLRSPMGAMRGSVAVWTPWVSKPGLAGLRGGGELQHPLHGGTVYWGHYFWLCHFAPAFAITSGGVTVAGRKERNFSAPCVDTGRSEGAAAWSCCTTAQNTKGQAWPWLALVGTVLARGENKTKKKKKGNGIWKDTKLAWKRAQKLNVKQQEGFESFLCQVGLFNQDK